MRKDTTLTNLQWFMNSQPNATIKMIPNELVFSLNKLKVSENRIIQALRAEDVYHDVKTTKVRNNRQQRTSKQKDFSGSSGIAPNINVRTVIPTDIL